MKLRFIITYILISVISILYILLFAIKMSNYGLSDKIADWASFGTLISPLVSLITMIILIMTIQDNQNHTKEMIQNSNINENENRKQIFDIQEINQNNRNIKELSDLTIEMYKKVAYFFEKYKIYKDIERKIESTRNNRNILPEQQRRNISEFKVEMIRFEEEFVEYEDLIITSMLKIETIIHLYFKNHSGAKILSCANYLKDLFRKRENVYNKIGTFFEITTDFNYLCLKYFKELKDNFPLIEKSGNEMVAIMNEETKKYDEKYKLKIIELNEKEEAENNK